MNTTRILPIENTLPSLCKALQTGVNAVLVAPPGAGKTTRVPLALLEEAWARGRRIIMLEPRRLAARSAARFMAETLGEQVGATIGYRVRLDTKVSKSTRIEVVTEGVLTRILQADPTLDGVGSIIFDEFHERNVHTDLGLALSLQSQAIVRPDLRLLVMSATLEAEPVARLLGQAPVVSCAGQSYPVETRYLGHRHGDRIETAVSKAICAALGETEGDMLVFLPGAGEIHRVAAQLAERPLGRHIVVAPLYGDLSQTLQDQAIQPSHPGKRKIVLATSIAETSLTVEGIRVVIDSGLMRKPRFSPRTGLTSLVTVPVTRASADQRQGRAGRLASGVCYRLWTEQEHNRLTAYNKPEILDADLVSLALELSAWGVSDPGELRWIDPPPSAGYAHACRLLVDLGALDDKGAITKHGQEMARLGVHPRLSHMILKSVSLGMGSLACDLAALLSERDVFRSGRFAHSADLRLRVESLSRWAKSKRTEPIDAAANDAELNGAALQRVFTQAEKWRREFGISSKTPVDAEVCGLALAFAYPDRIAQRRQVDGYLLCNGRGAVLSDAQSLAEAPYIVAADLDNKGSDSRIFLAAPVSLNELREHFCDGIVKETMISWDHSAQSVRGREIERLGALTLADRPLREPDPTLATKALLEGIAQEGLETLSWSKSVRQLQQRMLFMRQYDSTMPDVSDPVLLATLDQWLAPYVYGLKSLAELSRIDLAVPLLAGLSHDQRRELDVMAPTHVRVPSGLRAPIDYSNPDSPAIAVRLQELFGQENTPLIAKGKVPLTVHLLSPAGRPVQVTQDLASFWQQAYFEVRKDLRGRYPKHYWPDDPLKAEPTNRTRPKV